MTRGEYPAPERRVREFVDVYTEVHPDGDYIDGYEGADLMLTDLRDVLAELEEARFRLESLDK